MKIAIAGSTKHTALILKTLHFLDDVAIVAVITPTPKPSGRDKIVQPNPVHLFAQEHNLPTVLIEKTIDDQIKKQIVDLEVQPDFLVVLDFGYLIPNWLLAWPKLYPVNIHPSALPRWRGSAPGQYAILFADNPSAVSFIIMDEKFDTGKIIAQLLLPIEPNWTQKEYYQAAFDLAAQEIGQILHQLKAGQIKLQDQAASPTMLAGRLTKEDSFIDWNLVLQLMANGTTQQVDQIGHTSTLLVKANEHHQNWLQTVIHATNAFQPWPSLWTIVPTKKGPKRLKLIETKIEHDCLKLVKVQLEGQQVAGFNQIKNSLV